MKACSSWCERGTKDGDKIFINRIKKMRQREREHVFSFPHGMEV